MWWQLPRALSLPLLPQTNPVSYDMPYGTDIALPPRALGLAPTLPPQTFLQIIQLCVIKALKLMQWTNAGGSGNQW